MHKFRLSFTIYNFAILDLVLHKLGDKFLMFH